MLGTLAMRRSETVIAITGVVFIYGNMRVRCWMTSISIKCVDTVNVHSIS